MSQPIAIASNLIGIDVMLSLTTGYDLSLSFFEHQQVASHKIINTWAKKSTIKYELYSKNKISIIFAAFWRSVLLVVRPISTSRHMGSKVTKKRRSGGEP